MSEANGRDVPWELIDRILLELPVESLARFKCVSKLWRSHISSTRFIQDYSKPFKTGSYPIFTRYSWPSRVPDYLVFRGFDKYMTVKPLVRDCYLRKVGSANGIVCFYSDNLERFTLTLWNPSTGDSLDTKLPHHFYFIQEEDRSYCFAFGCDPQSGDLKAAQLFNSEGFEWLVSLFSLKTRVWEDVADSSLLPHRIVETSWSSQALAREGSFHWLAQCEAEDAWLNLRFRTILCFSMRDKMLRQMDLPESLELLQGGHDLVEFTSLGDYEGMLTLFAYDHHRTSRCCCHIWVLEDYASHDSWKELGLPIALGKPFRVFGFLNNSTLLLKVKHEFISYNFTTQQIASIGTADFFVGDYRESFIKLSR